MKGQKTSNSDKNQYLPLSAGAWYLFSRLWGSALLSVGTRSLRSWVCFGGALLGSSHQKHSTPWSLPFLNGCKGLDGSIGLEKVQHAYMLPQPFRATGTTQRQLDINLEKKATTAFGRLCYPTLDSSTRYPMHEAGGDGKGCSAQGSPPV